MKRKIKELKVQAERERKQLEKDRKEKEKQQRKAEKASKKKQMKIGVITWPRALMLNIIRVDKEIGVKFKVMIPAMRVYKQNNSGHGKN